MPAKRASQKLESVDVFGQPRRQPKVFSAELYARISTNDQQALATQNRTMLQYAT
jgi:hypothetical protein